MTEGLRIRTLAKSTRWLMSNLRTLIHRDVKRWHALAPHDEMSHHMLIVGTLNQEDLLSRSLFGHKLI